MQFIDLKAQYNVLHQQINNRIQAVLEHGQFILGPEVAELEKMLEDYTGAQHCITCANGTEALQMLFMAYGIGEGDAVFCPDVTFVASVEPAYMMGATPVFCDITLDTYNLCPNSLERQIQAVCQKGELLPKAVIVVDFLGQLADYEEIEIICEKYGILLISDAAQSFGASINGRRSCSYGASATTSFFPAKPLGCYGDGGAIFTSDDSIAEICESIRVHGKGVNGKYSNVRIGLNSRLDTLQAAILLCKMSVLDREIEMRQIVANRYDAAFADKFVTPYIAKGGRSVYAQYALLAKDHAQREAIVAKLNVDDIPNMVYYPIPQHQLPVFSSLSHYQESFANANEYCVRTFSLPMSPYLTEDDQNKVIDAVLRGLHNA